MRLALPAGGIALDPAQRNNKHYSNLLADILSFKSGHFILETTIFPNHNVQQLAHRQIMTNQ